MDKMKLLKGTPVSPGIVRGVVCLYSNEADDSLPHYVVQDKHITKELARLQEAVTAAQEEMNKMVQLAEKQLDEEVKDILKVYLSMLDDKSLYKKIADLIKKKKINAEHAVNDVFEEYIKSFQTQDKHFQELTNDFIDIRNRIIRAFNLEVGGFVCPIGDRKAVIVASKRLTTSMVLNIPRENVLAFVTEQSGITNHATILARSYGVPHMYGIDVEKHLDCGMDAIVDASASKVIISPDQKTIRYYDKKIESIAQKKKYCKIREDILPSTKEGTRIKLKLNISITSELDMARGLPHDGIGLLRTEFLFVGRNRPPLEDEQYEMYKKILEENKNKSVTIRLLDIGIDKMPTYFKLPESLSYNTELRGAMAVETFTDIYLTQARALLRAGLNNQNLQLLYPMVSDLNDLKTWKDLLKKARKLLKDGHVKFNNTNIKEGVMVETPSAVMMVGELLREVDFINIGSNDLLQYTLAASRGDLLIENRYHILHPALVKLMEIIVSAGKRAKKEVCLCGEIAFFEEFYPLFLQIGLRSFSLAVSKFPDIKCELLHLKASQDKDIVKSFYRNKSKKEINEYFGLYI